MLSPFGSLHWKPWRRLGCAEASESIVVERRGEIRARERLTDVFAARFIIYLSSTESVKRRELF